MTDELLLVQRPSLDEIAAALAPEDLHLAPGGRAALIAAALVAGIPVGARVLEVGCGLGAAAVDLAEAFGCRVEGFDSHGPYVAQAGELARSRRVSGRVTLRQYSGAEALATYPPGSHDVVLGLGGVLADALPGGRPGGLAVAARWLPPGGVLICSDLIAAGPAPPSDLLRLALDAPPTEATFLAEVAAAGFALLYAARATHADWVRYHAALAALRRRPDPDPRLLDPDPLRQRLVEAAQLHPEVAYLQVVARKS